MTDIFGQNVNLAARLASYAAPGEIIASEAVVEALSPLLQTQTRFLNKGMPKGLSQSIPVYQVVVGDSNLTKVSTRKQPTSTQVFKLRNASKRKLSH